MRFYIALWFGKIIGIIGNLIDKNRGSKYAGQKAMGIDPDLVSHFKGIDFNKVIFVSGTNGKSTTTNLLYHVLKSNNKNVIANLEGANMLTGLATILVKNSTLTGKVKADYIIMETDERYFAKIREQFPGKNLLLTNLQKDQAQRNGEPVFVMSKIMDGVKANPKLNMFLNNQEPRSKSFAEYGDSITLYGVNKHIKSFTKDESYASIPCPKCFHKIEFKHFNNEYIGPFKCVNCGFGSEDKADYIIDSADFDNNDFTVNGIKFSLPYTPPYMLYNVAAVSAVAREVADIEIEDTVNSFDSFKNISGRFESLKYKDKTINYMRFKQENPETLQTFLNEVSADPQEKVLALGLDPIEDEIPFFIETFYAFDCDFSGIKNTNLEKIIAFSNVVCYDTANRFIYEGIELEKIATINSDNVKDIMEAIDSTNSKTVYLGTKLYTFNKIVDYIKGVEA